MRRTCSTCPGSPAGILVIPPTIWSTSEKSTSTADDAGILGAFEEWLAGGKQARATLREQRGVRIEVVRQFLCQRPFRGQIADQPLEPVVERLPRVGSLELGRRATDLLHLIDVKRL